jgi:protein-S-isoprenylcysteine O-methyltransferase Ste14
MTIAGHDVWLPPLVLSLVAFGSFAWAIRGHFEKSIPVSNEMRRLSIFSLFSYMIYIASLTWHGHEAALGTALGSMGFALSILLFWWTVATTKPRPPALAHSDIDPDIIYTEGPYAYVRHPFYLSYVIFWIATALAAGSWQWAPAIILVFWYLRLAKGEERRFRSSALSTAYDAYRGRTGMFLPRLGSGRR